ncbi:MAG: 16S rRNA (cytosine(1402)-N(4))-methyltransferase [Burkholderiales bacterium RIFOXYD2_FULL_59_8]|nr:MAG: 16S rRNA (cytosine(1402)-N(4))-methyltransferase [Burkholderiales bacterium RIFOXYD2_FULL_59_8]
MKRARLLFIDDEEINRNNFQQTFADEYEILLAASGEEALEIMAREDDLALILSDQRMPGLSGVEILARARELVSQAERIMITGYSDPDDIMAAINQGQVYNYILKPWASGELRIAIIQAVERHQLKKENRLLLSALEKKNAELEELQQALAATLRVLQPGGRLVVISFHSLEDRIVKQFLTKHSREVFDRRAPFAAPQVMQFKVLARVKPGAAEVAANPRSRSAIMRVAARMGPVTAEQRP